MLYGRAMNKYKPGTKKGTALMDYALSAIVFGLVIGVAVFQLNPHLLRNYFKYSLGQTVQNGSQFQMKVLGE
jgi:uncharacterized protein YqhQ